VSVIDELKGLEDRVARRMNELRPLVDEYRELEQVAERLGVSAAAAAAAGDTPARPRRSRRRPRATARANAGTRGASRNNGRRDQLLAMVKDRPGITVREVGSELGVDPTSLYRIVHRLEQDGALQKRGRELLPG
jgi:DNA invertase Pin-like site-specific DNA recombinase